ncbi:glutamyl-tRNA(Gln) amidotransferase subunit A, chloroplastic/mitochondrial [Cannabis sativa]|uniref:glutamyl-tRNA(Gln) amidotransferase subunit A, chloroplastic/mitochondrial n=1 Tax=Cannabis sativa TaxID=3483 RepID=UPI0029CA650C|nr:glutamyl-tRNA(Gln) amidotransferase subunit A, chloroplastic/mitochondrial [Cannabis sativa]XP_060958144.1 glutamyl-tRNA(Gln) amidotransferase subunit A, chloroplastic/mitochondrial [Cannabis sativa]XP_060958145.1 glutamyl-tRNA(Gln) amidotransferase subunit A, chloroplastic/mitochondrial [Cannabis sativa]
MLSTMHPPRSLSCFPSSPISLLRHHTSFNFKALSSLSTQPLTPTDTQASQSSQILNLRHSLLSRKLTATQLVNSFLTRLRLTEPSLKSFLHVSDSLLRQAQELDDKINRNEELGPLAGVLVGVKDNICTSDMPSTGGSRVLDGYRPPFDATAVRKIKEQGGIIVGKTNLDEFGMGSTTEASAYQVTANPWDVSRVPGGSSGGSAAAVSARQCMVSLGSDTGGSVRQPASFCGVVGLKPTYGRVSRFGLMAYASSLDVIGCFGSSVADAGILLHAISGHDRLDATSSKQEVPDFTSLISSINFSESKPLKGLRVGLIRETIDEGVDHGVTTVIRGAASHLEELGCSVSEVSLPSFSLGLPSYYILASSESSSNLSRYDGVRYGNQAAADELNSLYGDSRAKGFGNEVKMRILMGTYALSAGYYDAYYKRAQQVRTIIRKSFKTALDEHDILISPASPSAAYKIGEKKNDPLAMYAGDIMTVNVNLAGLPALVLPCGFVEGGSAGLPVGLQMIGAAFDEGKLLKVGHIFEQTLKNSRFVPPLIADE